MTPITPLTAKKSSIRSIVLYYNEDKPETVRSVKRVMNLFKARGVRVWLGGMPDMRRRLPSADLAIAMGGDGTMLRAARLVAPHSIPLLGINTGGLGFLSATDVSQLRGNIVRILSGKFELQERCMLSVEVYSRGKRIFGPNIALNDCVIRCGNQVRAITLKASCSKLFVADYFGDGLIISTPTGSTAYALAAGGPVVDPRLDSFLIVPICPHTLTQRPLIIPVDDPITVRLARRNSGERPLTLVSLDGQLGCWLPLGAEVRVSRYEKPFRLLVNPKRSYFEGLRGKLKWGER
jgi:NAD+ kinase